MQKLLFPLLLSLLLLSCNNPRKGALSPESRGELYTWAISSLDTDKKYLKLAEKTAQMLEEAVNAPQDQQAMDIVTKFIFDNDLAITRISQEFRGWHRYAEPEEVSSFAALLNSQSYARRLRELVPMFRQRINYSEAWLREFDAFINKLEIRR
ncbi:MAG: hypothetical protein EAZ89_02765 [Bacteroidetes bacterium]|nr:MAG: hypothetical protein EAZ89_02765 [Bacteroidota bacterium]